MTLIPGLARSWISEMPAGLPLGVTRTYWLKQRGLKNTILPALRSF